MTRNNKPWTKEEEQFVIDSYAVMSDGEIGKQLKRTPTAVMLRRKKLLSHRSEELDKKISIMYWKGYSDRQISAELNITIPSVKYRRSKLGLLRKRGRNKEDKQFVLYENGEYVAGGTLEEIADSLNVSPATVENYRYKSRNGRKGMELIRIE